MKFAIDLLVQTRNMAAVQSLMRSADLWGKDTELANIECVEGTLTPAEEPTVEIAKTVLTALLASLSERGFCQAVVFAGIRDIDGVRLENTPVVFKSGVRRIAVSASPLKTCLFAECLEFWGYKFGTSKNMIVTTIENQQPHGQPDMAATCPTDHS